MLPNLSALDIGAKRRRDSGVDPEEDDSRLAPAARRLYKDLVERILVEFKRPISGSIVFDPCEQDSVFKATSINRRNTMRATSVIEDSSFTRQRTSSSGTTLGHRIQEQTAKDIASLFFQTEAQLESRVRTTDDRTRVEIFTRYMGAEDKEQVWKALAEDAYRSLREGGISAKEGDEVTLELSVQRANEETYKGRSTYVHMDGATYHVSEEDFQKGSPDSYAASFCAQKVQFTDPVTSAVVPDILILDCGTILYTGVPVITREEIYRVVGLLKKDPTFAPCTDISKIVYYLAQDLNDATTSALSTYSDEVLAQMEIKTTQVEALTWMNSHTRTFHRSPVYSDMFWSTDNKPSDPWALTAWKWMKKHLTSSPAETDKMRFFSRLAVRSADPAREVESFINKRFKLDDGTDAFVSIRTDFVNR
jgi:hypothetical protein